MGPRFAPGIARRRAISVDKVEAASCPESFRGWESRFYLIAAPFGRAMFIETAHESPKILERGSALPLSTIPRSPKPHM